MALADDLADAAICERDSVLGAVGWADDYGWFEYSNTRGATKGVFQDSSARKAVCALVSPGTVDYSIAVYSTSEIEVSVPGDETTTLYVSRDGGETWAAAGTL